MATVNRVELTLDITSIQEKYAPELKESWGIGDLANFEQNARIIESIIKQARQVFKDDLYTEACLKK